LEVGGFYFKFDELTLSLFTGDMTHGHSHGDKNKKSKNKKDEDSVEAGDGEHLCADERAGIEDNNGPSHVTGLLTIDNNRSTNDDKKSKKNKKKGSKIFENKKKENFFSIYSGWWSNEYSWCFSSCIK
jgi:hypothetical protein